MKNTITTIILSLFTIGVLYSQSCARELSSLEPNDPNNSNWVVPADGVTCVSSDITINRLEIADGGTLIIAEEVTLTIAQGVFPDQIPNRNSTIEVHGNLKFNQATVIPMSTDLTVHENGSLSVGNGNANLNFKGNAVNFLNKGTVAFSVLDLSDNSNAYFDNEGTMNVNQNINIAGKAEFINTGSLTIGSSFNNNADSRYINCGEVQTGGFNLQGGEVINTGIFNATSTIEMNESSSSIKNYNTFTANSINLAGATIYNAGYFTLPTITSTGNLEGPDSESNYWGSFTFNGPQNGFNTGNISGQLNIIDQNDPSSNANLFNPSNAVDSSVVFGTCTSCTVNTDNEECPSSDNPLVAGSAVDDNAATDQNTPVSIDVAANDIDMDETTVSITNQPVNGTVEVNATTGIVTYWPNEDYAGPDTFTYQICTDNTETDCETAEVTIDVLELPCSVPINGNYFEWDYENSNDDTVTETIQQPSANAGFVIDIWRLDNSFNMNINGDDLATSEIEFQSSGTPAPGINIRFQDGDEYETNTSPNAIWKMQGSEETPLIRVKVGPNGNVSMFGSKVDNGPLYPLELFNGNSFNTVTWNPDSDNTVIFTQNVVGVTNISGKGYGLNQTDSPVITVLNIIQPTCVDGESANNGAIEMTVTGLVDGVYSFQYDGGTLENVEVVNGEAVANNLSGGDYNNIVVGSGNCQSPQGVSAMLIEPDCGSCIEVLPGGEWNQSISKAEANQLNPPVLTYDPITVAGTNAGMFLDIYRLDNSFDLTINGTAIATEEIQFDSGTPAAPSNNIRFLDGDLYRYDAPAIWQIVGTSDKPVIRVEISQLGEVTLYGSKVSGGPLYELVLSNGAALNTVTWNETTDNSIEVTQDANGWTRLHGKVYGESICSTGLYNFTKTSSFDNSTPAEVGDIITYTIIVENVANEDISDVVVMDPLLGGELSGYVESDTNDDILNIDETWTYTAQYAITSEDIANGGVYNQATIFGKDVNGNAIPTKKSYDPAGAPGPDPDCATCTFTPLTGDDNCEVRYPIESEDPFYWIVNGSSAQSLINQGTVVGTNGGFVFDIYRLDNSFNMNINGTDLSTQEIQFQSQATSGINVRFKDGDSYEVDTQEIWRLRGNRSNPMLRVKVALDGSVQLFGTKVTNGELFELELFNGNSFNNIAWESTTENTVIVSQSRTGKTAMDGSGYGVEIACKPYELEKIGEFNDESGDGVAQPGETIKYTFILENTGNMDVYDPMVYDALLGGEITIAPVGDTNNDGVLNIGETWVYQEVIYEVTQENIARKGVYNQAEATGYDIQGQYLTPVLSKDPGNTSPDAERPDHTFVLLIGEECINQVNVANIEYRAYGSPNNGQSTTNNISVRASNEGYVLDFYKLDNSFNININGTDISTDEIEFQSRQTSGINVQFADGDQYEVDTPLIYRIIGDEVNPMLKLIINKNGEVSLLGSKTSYGPLFALELINGDPFNTVPWNNNDDNTISISQKLNFLTILTADGHVVINQCANDYVPFRPNGEENGLENHGKVNTIEYYPNPVNSMLYVEANTLIESLEIFNLLGQKVINLSPNSKETDVNMEFLQANVYMMKITVNGKTETYRVVKE
ncbi:DUF7507 domain-containing protein [Aequorivita marina]|uniref:DUF7507 domain-containing protein n=1 Tax=Aequorivita marina TaxID=3073654 RepID=UPI0028749BEB|nr:Ig-like domain-containing protein [Aequorivita sp. S2608]MDS1299085.1 Ig-like domain-containing protein [Aequorivita sp. S2608]